MDYEYSGGGEWDALIAVASGIAGFILLIWFLVYLFTPKSESMKGTHSLAVNRLSKLEGVDKHKKW